MPRKRPRTKSIRSVGNHHTSCDLGTDGQLGSFQVPGYCGQSSNLGFDREHATSEQYRHDYDNEENEHERVQSRTGHDSAQHQHDFRMSVCSQDDTAENIEEETMNGTGSSNDAPIPDTNSTTGTPWLDYLHGVDGPYTPDLSFAYQPLIIGSIHGGSAYHSPMADGPVSEDEDEDEGDGGAVVQAASLPATHETPEYVSDNSVMHWAPSSPNNVVAVGTTQTPLTASFAPAPSTELLPSALGAASGTEDGPSAAPGMHSAAASNVDNVEPPGQEPQSPMIPSPPMSTMLGTVNMGLGEFLEHWAQPGPPISHTARPYHFHLFLDASRQLTRIRRADLKGNCYDFQGINWHALGVTREHARRRRSMTYQNYVNWHGSDEWLTSDTAVSSPHSSRPRLEEPLRRGIQGPASGNYFRFREMHIRNDVSLAHFQLRSSLASPCRSRIYYASRLGISKVNPVSGKHGLSLQWTEHPMFGRSITTIGANQDILVAGTFSGEYIVSSLYCEGTHKFTEGMITQTLSGITNHLQVHTQRSTSNSVAAISSNDKGFRVLDLETQQFVSEFDYDFALNCSAVSPDRRLRVVVGDSKDVTIANAETGETEVLLTGHGDYGFACDWSEDGRYLATGFQDKSIKVWDPRKWKSANGASTPVHNLWSDLAGPRNLKFSPLGSGEPVLVSAEEADFVQIYSTRDFGKGTFDAGSRQTFSVFGEIGGIDFAEGGRELNVLVADSQRGGILQLERCSKERDAMDAIPLF